MTYILRIALVLLIITHAMGCVALVIGGLMLPFIGLPWPVWGTLGTLLVQMVTNAQTRCILTDLENYLRKQLGMPQIEGFIIHYLGPIWGRK